MGALRDLANGVVDERVDRLTTCLEDLNSLLHEYMITGGLPSVVVRYEREQILGDPEYETYADALLGEWHRLGKNTSMLVGFGKRLVETTGSPVSWEGISNKSSLGSPNTARDYVDTLERLFAVSVMYGFDMTTRAPMFGKNKKIYFTDPFLLHMFRTWSGPHILVQHAVRIK